MKVSPLEYMVSRGVLTAEEAARLPASTRTFLWRALLCGYRAAKRNDAVLLPNKGELDLDEALASLVLEYGDDINGLKGQQK